MKAESPAKFPKDGLRDATRIAQVCRTLGRPFAGAAVAPTRTCATIDYRGDRATVIEASVDPRFGLR
jgi:hypothetical protein